MNPSAPMHSAVRRDRKPFTYTPGGLDLSEIKSERMAQRLMRNAMNQGVPEVHTQPVLSPPASSTPVAVPNFNCMPVQVFPTFPLPANPKSLLRTRSNPDQTKAVPLKTLPGSHMDINLGNSIIGCKKPEISNEIVSGCRPPECVAVPGSNNISNIPCYGSNGHTLSLLPKLRCESEYIQDAHKTESDSEKNNITVCKYLSNDTNRKLNLTTETDTRINLDKKMPNSDEQVELKRGVRLVKKVKKEKKTEEKHKKSEEQNGNDDDNMEVTVKLAEKKSGAKTETNVDVLRKILEDGSVEEVRTTTTKTTIDGETDISTKTETRKLPKEEADAIKKLAKEKQNEQSKRDNENNVNQNGDDSNDTELVIKLPTKKTAAKTETKVEIENKILPDGTVEETKTTITKTTVDGKTNVATKVDKRILSKEEAEAAIEVVEEEEEEETEETNETETKNDKEMLEEKIEEVEQKPEITINESRSDTTTVKKVVVTQNISQDQESDEENIEEEEEEEEIDNEPKDDVEKEQRTEEQETIEDEEQEEEEEDEQEDVYEESRDEVSKPQVEEVVNTVEEEEDEEVEEESEEETQESKSEVKELEINESPEKSTERCDKEQEDVEDEQESEVEVQEDKQNDKSKPISEDKDRENLDNPEESAHEPKKTSYEIPIADTTEKRETEEKEDKKEIPPEIKQEIKPPLKEPVVPLEKVEEIEIKPIGPVQEVISKTKTENTEIILSSNEKPLGPLSTQTEFNRYENIVTVNRTTKTLDQAYEKMTQQSMPTVKTYFAPGRDRLSQSPYANKLNQSIFDPEPQTERRHSLLLERLSMERQLPPADIYHQSNQHEQRQWSQEPQSEVVTVSNVKPSTITNQEWFQQSKNDSVIYNNITNNTASSVPTQWNQPQTQVQTKPQFQPNYQYQPQSQFQAQPKPQYQPQHEYQPSYTENLTQDYSKSINESCQKNSYPSYNSLPSNIQSNQYSAYNKDSSENYQKTTQQYSTSYVPPPWEQDSSYTTDNANQSYFQSQPTNMFSPSSNKSWQPTTPIGKFTKPAPTSYIPPAPNQSFVKPAASVDQPKIPGRKTYYSEYERRYISVPESTYVPGETKFQAQPDPSPKFYYDNSEPTEKVEHEWRKELREFTEKTSQTQYKSEQENVRPPWEDDPKYVKVQPTTQTSTPSWSQTVRPRSWRDRTFESEYSGTQEWPKTNTLGRGRPVSSYVQSKTETLIPERPRGVSVDRYNPNSYQSPIASEHPPVQTHTLTPPAPHAKSYHNPNVPAYHTRVSAEPREQPQTYQQPRMWGDSRSSPLQSRSFKYLQWITGTEN